ncbi:MAG TPA: general secretion pathway protein GspD [Bacteroidia bacterium]|nr:general secretion pathway protein GspD [Bacteroidia bacterium]
MPLFLRRFTILLFLLNVYSISSIAQTRFDDIELNLNELSKKVPGLNFTVNLSVNGTTLQEFLRSIAVANDINLSVDPALTTKITNNFSNVKVTDVLVFLCKKYDLDVKFAGSIIEVIPFSDKTPLPAKTLSINYSQQGDLLSYDFKDDSLVNIAKEITKRSGKNILVTPELNAKTVSGFIKDLKFDIALDKLALTNDLKISSDDGTVFLIEKKERDSQGSKNNSGGNKPFSGNLYNNGGLSISIIQDSLLNVAAAGNPIMDVLNVTSKMLKKRFFLYSEIKGSTSLSVTDVSFDQFLSHLLNNTDYTFKKTGELYLFGERNLEGLRETKTIQLKYRTADKMIDVIPAEMKKGVELKPFPDLNSIIVSGSNPRIEEIEKFLADVDKVVPVVLIEVMIVDVRNSRTVSSGIQAGIGDKSVTTQGTVYPGMDVTLSSQSVNNLISGLTGLGSVNLGKVTPNFYLKLKLLEEQGYLKLRSTPKLATLNGHEAKLSIGRTEYYQESQTTVIGAVNTGTQTAISYKPVTADLAVTINPMVSGDEQITLEVNVKQSSFTERIAPTAPPGTISRDFQSLIRVRNEEMIILGGLEENSNTDTGSGVPLLSRIPVLKWFFGSRTKGKGENKLIIFIKPTVIY